VTPASPSKKKMVLCISGMTGCGKSTVAKKIAAEYQLRYCSGGDALKALAIEKGYQPSDRGWWESAQGVKFLRNRMQDPSFDKQVDQKLLHWAKQGNVVLDSWTMPWLLEDGFKIWLDASPIVRAQRIAQRDGTSLETARAAQKVKDEHTKSIYKKLYGFALGEDFSPFDLILDVNDLTPNEVLETLRLVTDNLVPRVLR
jgi:cytidylate kinase